MRPIEARRCRAGGQFWPPWRSYLRALGIWAAQPSLDFEDALTVAHMERLGLQEVVSYDSDFGGIPNVQRVEP